MINASLPESSMVMKGMTCPSYYRIPTGGLSFSTQSISGATHKADPLLSSSPSIDTSTNSMFKEVTVPNSAVILAYSATSRVYE